MAADYGMAAQTRLINTVIHLVNVFYNFSHIITKIMLQERCKLKHAVLCFTTKTIPCPQDTEIPLAVVFLPTGTRITKGSIIICSWNRPITPGT